MSNSIPETPLSNPFRSTRAAFWLAGTAALVLGFLAIALVLATAPTPGAGGPEVHVPSMQNVPSENAPKLELQLETTQATEQ